MRALEAPIMASIPADPHRIAVLLHSSPLFSHFSRVSSLKWPICGIIHMNYPYRFDARGIVFGSLKLYYLLDQFRSISNISA